MGVVTIKDIAEKCGVSRGTVDRALHDRGNINEKTKIKILETAKQMGYQPNFIARSLVKGKTNTLGVVVFDVYNEFFCEILNAIDAQARKRGYLVNLMLTNKIKEIERKNVENLIAHKVDGIILCSVNNEISYVEWLNKITTPIVTLGNRISKELLYIGIEEQNAMNEAVKLIYSHNYERIIYISPPLEYKHCNNIYAQQERYIGLCKSVNFYNLESIIVKDKEYIKTLNSIDLLAKKTVIMCSSDIFAIDILMYLKERQISIPNDIGVMGFDNINILNFIKPKLTTINYPKKEIGELAAKLLINNIERVEDVNSDKKIILPYKIVEGESLG